MPFLEPAYDDMHPYDNALFRLLRDLGAIDADRIEPYSPKVRDRRDLPVFRCARSGVIFLGRIDQAEVSYYQDKNTRVGGLVFEDHEIPFTELDNARRQAETFGYLVEGRRWLDVGCGTGALLGQLGPRADRALGVEPNRVHRENAPGRGVDMVASLDDVPSDGWDVITLFHVFEHLAEPLAMAARLKAMLRPGGVLLIEVPHARDFLLETLDCDEFRRFTLWSEHLVLHTRDSLTTVLKAAGFESVDVTGYQRFPLSNHLHWLRHGLPGGHEKWAFLNRPDLMAAYASALADVDQTDTIVALARF